MTVNRKPKKKSNSLRMFVAFSLTAIMVFTLVMIFLFYQFQAIPDTLVTCYYACMGGEVLSCALIKCLKLKSGDE